MFRIEPIQGYQELVATDVGAEALNVTVARQPRIHNHAPVGGGLHTFDFDTAYRLVGLPTAGWIS